MSYMIRISFLFLINCILFLSCKKKGDNEKLDGPNTSVTDFMSTKEGSWWLYGSNESTVIKRMATGADSTKLDLFFDYYEALDTNTNHITPEYFGKNGELYLTLIDIDGSQKNYIPAVVQKDNAKVGDTWLNTGDITYSGMKFDLKIEGEIESVNETITVGPHTFTNVVRTKSILKGKASAQPVFVKCGEVTMWFAKGIGIIKSNFEINILEIYKRKYSDSLIQYHIEPE